LDVIFQTSYDHYKLFIPSFLDGSINAKRFDDAVLRVLKAKFELGLFENPYVPEEEILTPITIRGQNHNPHKALAKEAALKSIVLLKNNSRIDGNSTGILPLNKNIKSLAVIGTDATEARLGGYSGPGNGKVSILDGIKNRAGNKINVLYAPGCGRKNEEWVTIPPGFLSCMISGKKEIGLKGEYFNNIALAGTPALLRPDKTVDFHWTLFSPDPAINNDFYSVRWSGKLQAPRSGKYKIGLEGNDGFRLYLDNQLLIDNWKKQTYSEQLASFNFEKDKEYHIRIEFFEPVGNAHLKLIWNIGVAGNWKKKIADAMAIAGKADAAIVVAGITEGEFLDRAMLSLPGHQEELIQKIAAAGKPVIVLLVGGSAITMNNWIDKTDAVLDVWYPGEEGGNAVAEVLFGDYNPAGRLPVTFPISEAQLPLVYNHKPTGRGDDYNNLSGLPLFPFGFGLSYTSFEYSNVQLEKTNISKNESVIVHFKIRNTGKMAGDDVVQLYIRDLLSSVSRPVMELKGFQRIHLSAGESKELSFIITPEMLSMLNKDLKTVVEPGDFRIMIGASSRDIRLKTVLTVKE
ncbi:MAG TPA: glycoside hydrolase family 3 C-terminal domain-containing protein, partial [Chitinophagaceae bacterium]|nr:glycoside hydrolase family 3 C-terminal domain-containing protein [Chitinophagaceae bacterium]